MKFFKQTKPNTCNVIAIQHVLAFFNQYSSQKEIQKELPKHNFGDLIQEIGIYLKNKGINSTLISNFDKDKNPLFLKTLNKYKKLENFKNRKPTEKDIKN